MPKGLRSCEHELDITNCVVCSHNTEVEAALALLPTPDLMHRCINCDGGSLAERQECIKNGVWLTAFEVATLRTALTRAAHIEAAAKSLADTCELACDGLLYDTPEDEAALDDVATFAPHSTERMADMDADAIKAAVERECYFDDQPERPLTAALVALYLASLDRPDHGHECDCGGHDVGQHSCHQYHAARDAVTAIVEGSEAP
jgi:hypothetical protein